MVYAAPKPRRGLFSDRNLVTREWIKRLTATDVDGARLHIGHAFPGLPQDWRRGSSSLGENNEYVYKDLIGVDDNEYRELVKVGIATSDYLDRAGQPV